MRIVLFQSEPWEVQAAAEKLLGLDVIRVEKPLSEETIAQAVDADIITSYVDYALRKEQLDRLPNLKMIATRSTGFDHIDLAECDRRGIIVSTVPFYGENTVAEYAMALLLALSRKIPQSVERTRRGDFSNAGLRGFDLKGKIMGIIGGGHIGLHLARMAKAFDMFVQVYDVKPNSTEAKKIGLMYRPFDDILASSDVLSFHVPLLPQTYHLINLENLAKIKKGCVLINTARGPVVDTTAIVKGLDEGIFSAVGLDVLEEEQAMQHEKDLLATGVFDREEIDREKVRTVMENHVLLTYPNVIIAGHNAANTQEAMERISQTTLENIVAFTKGSPQNVVTQKK